MIERRVIPISLEEEMKRSYLDYAMSVIVGRALPEVRDGLKPVQRRILFAMQEAGNLWNRPFRKSARVVGDVVGKYHPHGDAAVYDALVRMAQDFSLRYPLVEGQGNFGSMDGDPPAAMRYTEVRLSPIAGQMLADLDMDTVDFLPNYDGTLREPEVLPARLPNLLVNGSGGIAVGMATNIPPHNLGEVVDALLALLDDPSLPDERLLEIIPGPDFPTGGIICGRSGLREAYLRGRGQIVVRGRATVQEERGRAQIVITELPFQVNKARLVERIAELARERKIEGIAEVRDESDREGMRVVVELRRDGQPQVVLNQLFQHTQLQVTFGIILLVIADRQPRVMSLRELLSAFLEHRREVVRRRSAFQLKEVSHRLHLVEGLRRALEELDEVVELIRGSRNAAEARGRLRERLGISEQQAQAILQMRLERLTALEREALGQEEASLRRQRRELEAILSDPDRLREVIRRELLELKERFADPRRTQIVEEEAHIGREDVIPNLPALVTITRSGYVKRSPLGSFRAQRRGGRGLLAMSPKEGDELGLVTVGLTLQWLLLLSSRGRAFWLRVHQLPEGERGGRGRSLVNFLSLAPQEEIAAALSLSDPEEGQLLVATRRGMVKLLELSALRHARSAGVQAIGLLPDDRPVSARLWREGAQALAISRLGMALRFDPAELRVQGRAARGVRGMRLDPNDELLCVEVLPPEGFLFTVTAEGWGKRTPLEEFSPHHRGGRGVRAVRPGEAELAAAAVLPPGAEELVLATNRGRIIRLRVREVPVLHRPSRGTRLMALEPGERPVGAEVLPP